MKDLIKGAGERAEEAFGHRAHKVHHKHPAKHLEYI